MPDTQDFRFTFDHVAKIVEILAPTLDMTVQEIVDAIAFHRWQPDYIDNDEISRAEGKVPIPGIGNSLIVLTMLDGWKIMFSDRPGPDWVQAQIGAGVTVSDDGSNPIAPGAFVNVAISQAVSGVSIQQPKIDELHQMAGLLDGSPMIESSTGRSSVAGISGDNINMTFTPNSPTPGDITLTRDP
jgi:hypothetical protein